MINNILLLKDKSVLFAEDDEIIKKNITDVLKMLFKEVYTVTNGQKAYELYEEESIDLVITDIKMPLMDGLDLTEKIRKKDYDIPIILLTNFTQQVILMQAVNLSIDGYITKPIELEDLISTIQKSMKRVVKNKGVIPLSKNIFYSITTQEVYQNNKLIQLGFKELQLLKLLIKNYKKTVTKDEISSVLWPLESVSDSSIKNLILRIRKKFDEDIITSVRGVGYRLQLEITK
ncbi:response regulator transcription factor [Halarcobacter anaerophilus]|uniref:DNA-binding response regulator n=1 Tax=Halarcobacter anaerophilus TaxID=877500 RepID=A0A4Q0Y699_9BACT|nr:response regulator transcription factor [Halarcobacter anaerophilus]QDF29121.1 two-component system response regulator [Halarcobacter anaerophilus]RXJ64379.1 DNA-binding response regulator [Halarcobacter anaerophilus]